MRNLLLIIMLIVLSHTIANAACALPGDTDGDGVVSIAEVQQVINAFLNLSPTYVISGKITNHTDGSAFPGATVTLYKANTAIYSIDGLYGANVTRGDLVTTATSSPDGSYVISGIRSGSYILTPARSGYVFNPEKTGVITITDSCSSSGNVYVYDPEKTGNSVVGGIIFNSTLTMTGNVLTLNFEGSTPGGSGF